MKVIETNLIIHNGVITDHQSRIVECNSWKEYVDAHKNYDSNKAVYFRSVSGLMGDSVMKNSVITNIDYDEFHLSCDVKSNRFPEPEKHLAYIYRNDE